MWPKNSEDEVFNEIKEKWEEAKNHRTSLIEHEWIKNEELMYDLGFRNIAGRYAHDTLTGSYIAKDIEENEQEASKIHMNQVFKYVRYMHALLSSNPPSGTAVPLQQSSKALMASKIADDIMSSSFRKYKVQSVYDRLSLNTLIQGTGWLYYMWNPFLGKLIDREKSTFQGDHDVRTKNPWHVWVDSGAECWEDCDYIFILHQLPIKQAISLFPEYKDKLKKESDETYGCSTGSGSSMDKPKRRFVDIIEYIEKGRHWNWNEGAHMYFTSMGVRLSDLKKNPYPSADFPVYPLTDVDYDKEVYGRPTISYISKGQAVIDGLDSSTVDSIRSNGMPRVMLPEGAEMDDVEITNSGWEVARLKGNSSTSPYMMQAGSVTPDYYNYRNVLTKDLDGIIGFNESMMGQQSREMSGALMQASINAGNLSRRRLFNKYTDMVRWFWLTFLENCRLKWEGARTINVVGEENMGYVRSFSTSDFDEGFELYVDYGGSFSLDPETRRQQILQMVELYRGAGVSDVKILEKLRANDAKGLMDYVTMSKRRQEEIFEEMILKSEEGSPVYIAPEEREEHKGMLDAAYAFRMTGRFKKLDPYIKKLIIRHIKEREQMAITDKPQMPEGAVPNPQEAQAPAAMPPGMVMPPIA